MGRRKIVIDKDIGVRLKKIRAYLGFTCKELGNEMGYSESYIACMEEGKRNVSKTVKNWLYTNHHVNPEWLNEGLGGVFIDESLNDCINEYFFWEPDIHFWDRVRLVRNALAISQSQIAEAMGTTQSYISLMEKNRARPLYQTIKVLENMMPGIYMHWIMTGQGPIFDESRFNDAQIASLNTIPIIIETQNYGEADQIEVHRGSLEYDLLTKFMQLNDKQKRKILRNISGAA